VPAQADLVMSVFGGMSKGERKRIKIRVRTAVGAQANPARAADGKRLHALAPDPQTAPAVRRIFAEYLAGRG
jgi:site-specific DNA recombinase